MFIASRVKKCVWFKNNKTDIEISRYTFSKYNNLKRSFWQKNLPYIVDDNSQLIKKKLNNTNARYKLNIVRVI